MDNFECKFCDESENKYCIRCECRYYNCNNLTEYLERKREGKSTLYCSLLYCLDHAGCEYWAEVQEYYEYIRRLPREYKKNF